jgi:hypothetical protein
VTGDVFKQTLLQQRTNSYDLSDCSVLGRPNPVNRKNLPAGRNFQRLGGVSCGKEFTMVGD